MYCQVCKKDYHSNMEECCLEKHGMCTACFKKDIDIRIFKNFLHTILPATGVREKNTVCVEGKVDLYILAETIMSYFKKEEK